MCKRTVRKGLTLMLAGVVSVTLATFFQDLLARVFFLTVAERARLTYSGLLLGGASGACGVLVAIAGLLRAGARDRGVRLLPVVLLLVTSIAFFCLLSYLSFTGNLSTTPGPGESISI
jgi:hypothetical protein